jgi:hypothetical protein
MKPQLEAKMHTALQKLGVNTKGFYNESLILLLKSQEVGKMTLLNLDLMVTGDVKRMGQEHPTFGITYLLKDSVEVEDAKVDVVDSLNYLLEEFSEQYVLDNEE